MRRCISGASGRSLGAIHGATRNCVGVISRTSLVASRSISAPASASAQQGFGSPRWFSTAAPAPSQAKPAAAPSAVGAKKGQLGQQRGQRLAVVKIGGGLLEYSELPKLIAAIKHMQKQGLVPILVHGGGPQLNEELERSGEEPKYVEGMRVTSPHVLSIAARVFQRENTKFVDALEEAGIRARPVLSVFESTPLNAEVYGMVGQTTRIRTEGLTSAIQAGYLPVLWSLGITNEGQHLNINADVAALELAKEVQPSKIIFLNTTAGLKDNNSVVIPKIKLREEYDEYMKQAWVKHGMRLKIKEIKNCLDALPSSSSVSITAPDLYVLTDDDSKGVSGGTVVSQGFKVSSFDKMNGLDAHRIYSFIEGSFKNRLRASYIQELEKKVLKTYVIEPYHAVAVLTNESNAGVPYLDKFAVDNADRGIGQAEALWAAIKRDNKSLFWRSRPDNSFNKWYYQHADGHVRRGEWVVFWYGLGDDLSAIQRCLEAVDKVPPSFDYVKPGSEQAKQSLVGSSKKSGGDKFRVGLVGGRGFTGAQLMRLLSQHSQIDLACATSSTQAGLAVTEVCPTAPKDLKFIDMAAGDFVKTTKNLAIDAWVLALHDKGSDPFVDAIINERNAPVLVDLSADHRFDSTWVYGQPEAASREAIRSSRRIANPGCYATGMFTTLAPLVKENLLDGPASFFGVSGYSGAGTKPSPKNDPAKLADNLMPYTLLGHTHEREVAHQLGGIKLFFTPHVAPFFQGISLTGIMRLRHTMTRDSLEALYKKHYGKEALITITKDIPEVKYASKRHGLTIGGLEFDPVTRRLTTITTLDNLLKGAATQAVQNLNLALHIPDELDGIRQEMSKESTTNSSK